MNLASLQKPTVGIAFFLMSQKVVFCILAKAKVFYVYTSFVFAQMIKYVFRVHFAKYFFPCNPVSKFPFAIDANFSVAEMCPFTYPNNTITLNIWHNTWLFFGIKRKPFCYNPFYMLLNRRKQVFPGFDTLIVKAAKTISLMLPFASQYRTFSHVINIQKTY